ncbi:MAG TPA: sensor histidine kinase [Firmicutes bacterium]|jgi:signal transduction histidine kinase|nr:sensor histidine kinase [Bacillota bacterium]
MKCSVLKTPFFALASFAGTCVILYHNPRFDWASILWLFLLTASLGFLHILWEKKEGDEFRRATEDLSNLLQSIEERTENIPLQDDCFGSLRDEIQKSLVSQRSIRDQALQAKEQLKRNMEDVTHQIKTPLTGVLLLLELLESDAKHAEEYQMRIRQQIEHLYDLSNLLLKLSSLDAGSITLEMEPFSAQGLFIDVEFCLDQILRQKELTIEVIGDDYVLVGDRMWLMEALLNIVKNAVEASPHGAEIHVLLHQNAIFQSITVKDRGPGLTPEQQKRVFERFYKSNPQSQGFGIGLSLAKSIVQKHRGELLVHSSSDGSEFEMRFYRNIAGNQ